MTITTPREAYDDCAAYLRTVAAKQRQHINPADSINTALFTTSAHTLERAAVGLEELRDVKCPLPKETTR